MSAPVVVVLGAKEAVQPLGQELVDWSALQPRLVIWQGDPTLQGADGPAWLNLAQHGWTDIATDGQMLWVEVER